MQGMDIAPELQAGINTTRNQTYLPVGGVLPDDIKTVSQLRPVPYRVNLEVAIYASNTDQHFQMLEQILILFNPGVQIQISDSTFDMTKITTMELMGIRFEQNYPSAADRRIIQTTLDFSFPIYLSAPAQVKSNFINTIYARIGSLTSQAAGNSSYSIVENLDVEGAAYTMIVTGNELKI
jgi:hypothetical protein